MNTSELKYRLDELGVNPDFYSLDGDLQADRVVLFRNYHRWEVFYLDEKGNRDSEKFFSSEKEACDYIYDYFKKQKEIEKKYK